MNTHDDLWSSVRARALLVAGDLGGLIRFARHARGWRQADLGVATGYSRSTISRIETARRAVEAVDLAKIRHITEAVGIPPHLLGELLGIATPAAATVAPTTTQPGRDDPMHRRQVMAAGLALPLSLLIGLDDALALLPRPATPPLRSSPPGWSAPAAGSTAATWAICWPTCPT